MVPPLWQSGDDERQIHLREEAAVLSPYPDLEGESGECLMPISERTSSTDLLSYSITFIQHSCIIHTLLNACATKPKSLAPLKCLKSLRLLSLQLIPPEARQELSRIHLTF